MFIIGLKYDCCANEFEMSSIILFGLTDRSQLAHVSIFHCNNNIFYFIVLRIVFNLQEFMLTQNMKRAPATVLTTAVHRGVPDRGRRIADVRDTRSNACFGVRDLADQRWSTHIDLNSPTGLLSPKYQQAPRQRCRRRTDEFYFHFVYIIVVLLYCLSILTYNCIMLCSNIKIIFNIIV